VCTFGEIGSSNSGVYDGQRRTPLVDQQFSYVRLAAPLLDTAAISIEFYGAISTQFCFTYSLGGVTAMPHGLHARLCHAFLVFTEKGRQIFRVSFR